MVSLSNVVRRFTLTDSETTMKKNFDNIFEELKLELHKDLSEIVLILKYLNDTNEELFVEKRSVWLPLLIKFCVNSSSKVRDKSFDLFEELSPILEENDFLLLKESLKKALQKSASLLNVLLPSIETAFKSDNQTIKCLAFDSWSCLIKNLASPSIGYISEPKRLNLIMQPLIVGSRRSERVAIEQVKTWMVILNVFRSDLETYFEQICAPLLRFCVGGECETIPVNPTSGSGSPQLNRSFRTPASPQTPKLYLTNADRSVGPKKLPCFPSVQAFLGEILLDFLCGPIEIKGLSRSLNYLPDKSCVQSSVTIEKHLSLISQSLRIWAATASKNDEVLLRCWEALSNCVVEAKSELSSTSFDLLVECYLLQFGQFLDECALNSRTKTSLLKFKNKVASVSLEVGEDPTGFTRGQSSSLTERQISTEFNTTEKLFGNFNVIQNDKVDPTSSFSTPPSQKSLISKPASEPGIARSTRLRKKLDLDRVSSEEQFVYVPPVEKKKTMVLTERQKDKFLQRKEMPYLDRTNSQTVDRVNSEMFTTESQLIEPVTLVDRTDPPVENISLSSTDTTKDSDVEFIEDVTDQEATAAKQPAKEKSPSWFRQIRQQCRPTVVVEKLTDHEIEILTQENVAETSLNKKTKKIASKKMPKSKSETDLPSDEGLFSGRDVVLASQPATAFDRRRRSVKTTTGKFDNFLDINRKQEIETSSDDCILIPDSCDVQEANVVEQHEIDHHENKTNDDSICDNRVSSPSIEFAKEVDDANSNLNDSNVCRIYPLVEKTSARISLSQPCEEKILRFKGSSNLFVPSQKRFSPYRLKSKRDVDDDEHYRSMTQIRPHPTSTLNELDKRTLPNETVEEILSKTNEIEIHSLNLAADGLKDYVERNAEILPPTFSSPLREISQDNAVESVLDSPLLTASAAKVIVNEWGPVLDEIIAVSTSVANESLDESDDDVTIKSIGHSNKMFSPCSTPSASSILKKRKRALAQISDNRPPISLTPPTSAGRRQVHFAPELMSNSDDEQQQIKVTPRKRARLDMSPPPTESDSNSKKLFCTPQSLFATKFSARTHAMISRINEITKSNKQEDLNESSSFASTGENVFMTKESVLDNSQPIWPSLVDNSADVGVVITSLVASSWDAGLLQELHSRNIRTVGHLARLTELDVHHLPIKQPKVQTIQRAFVLFEKNNKISADLDNSDLNISGVVPMEEDLDKSVESAKEFISEPLNKELESGGSDSKPLSEEKNTDFKTAAVETKVDFEIGIEEKSADFITDSSVVEPGKENETNAFLKNFDPNNSKFDDLAHISEEHADLGVITAEKVVDSERSTPLSTASTSSSNTTIPSGQPDYNFHFNLSSSSLRMNVEVQTDDDVVNVDSITEYVEKLLNEENVCKLSKEDKFKLYNFFETCQRNLFLSTFDK